MSGQTSPHYVDLYVGARLRLRRRSLGFSQTFVAQAVGLTFQQLQKYERGANRISASKLHDLARVLSISADWFFEGLPEPAADSASVSPQTYEAARTTQAFLMSPDGLEMAKLFPGLPRRARRHILALCHAMADKGDPG